MNCASCEVWMPAGDRCAFCDGPLEAGEPVGWEGWVAFGLDEPGAQEQLAAPGWSEPREVKLKRAWLLTWRADVRMDSSWIARVRYQGSWGSRAGWIDRWFDEIVLPNTRFPGLDAGGLRGLGEAERLPIFRTVEPTEIPWQPALATVLQQATGAQALGTVHADPPQDERRHRVLSPVWAARVDDRWFVISAAGDGVLAPFGPDRARARRVRFLTLALGLLLLGGSAALALPGIVIWPLLLLTALGSVLGWLVLAASTLPRAWTRPPRGLPPLPE